MELWEMDKLDKETYFRLRRSLFDDYKDWLAWLTDAQRAELKTLKDGGASNEQLKDQVVTVSELYQKFAYLMACVATLPLLYSLDWKM